MTEKTHYIYILCNENNQRTYVGYTTDPTRRLRQHNGQLAGGAKYTQRCQGWALWTVIHSPSFTKKTALSFEWHLKHQKYKGHQGRLLALMNNIKHSHVFKDLEYHIYVSQFCQSIISDQHIEFLIACDNIILYDDMSVYFM